MKIRNCKKMNDYIVKYKIDKIVTQDIKPFMELLLFKKNEYICREGEEIYYLLFFLEGKAKVYTSLSNGKSLLLSFYEGFNVLGDLELMNTQLASTSVQAIENSWCIGIPIKDVKKYLMDDTQFLRYICQTLSEKLNRCSKNSSINLLYPLESRLASYILATAESIDNNTEQIIAFNENLTEVSELLGTSYRHLLRTINTLCEKGAIIKRGDCYEVVNEKILKDCAADLYK